MSETTEFVSLNGSILPAEEALIPAHTSGIYYGAGCFETFKADENRIFKFKEHVDRLNGGLIYLGVDQGELIQPDELREKVSSLLTQNRLDQSAARVRIQVSLAEVNGYSEDESPNLIHFITAAEIDSKRTPVSLTVVNTRVVPSVSRPAHLKLSNMLHYRNAWREAKLSGADDALMLTVNGNIAETAIGNLFWKEGRTIYTPSTHCDILPGIMRNSVIEMISKMDQFSIKEGEYSLVEIKKADFVWMTNSVAEILPVHQIDNIQYSPANSFHENLTKLFHHYKAGHLS